MKSKNQKIVIDCRKTALPETKHVMAVIQHKLAGEPNRTNLFFCKKVCCNNKAKKSEYTAIRANSHAKLPDFYYHGKRAVLTKNKFRELGWFGVDRLYYIVKFKKLLQHISNAQKSHCTCTFYEYCILYFSK